MKKARIKQMKRIKLKVILTISFLLICYSTPIFARYYENLECFFGKAIIAEPIIRVEQMQDTINIEINKENEIKEYRIIVKNYEIEANKKRINEVDFLYDIEIKNSDYNFPIKCKLFDVETGKELLNGTNKVQALEILKNIEYEKEYVLQVMWENKENMSAESAVDILITASQKK